MFEYIGEMSKDYIYAVTPLLEDALTDRDLVHRQTASAAIKHLSLGVHGLNCEDSLIHLLNFVWPNIFEQSPHVINAVTEAIEGLRVSLGAGQILMYTLQGLFHPARRVHFNGFNSRFENATGNSITFCMWANKRPWWPSDPYWSTWRPTEATLPLKST